MAKTIYLLQFNNYFNRTVRGPYSSIGDYTSNGATIVGQITNMSLWNPNDGVDTTITSSLGLTAVPDYCVVEEGTVIIQRWFVIEAKRIQGQQYRLTLHRDVLAEENEKIMTNTESYIERGWCDVSDPAIYNSEPITFNQIKTSQTLMYDKSCTPWIVGYIVPPDTSTTVSFKLNGKLYKVDINNNIQKVEDAAYAIFYMPYENFDFYYSDETYITQPSVLSRKVATEISREFSSSGVLMDLQILPYCPTNAILRDGFRKGNVPTFNVPIRHVKDVSEEGVTEGFMGLCISSSTSGDIYTYTTNELGVVSTELVKVDVKDIKNESQTVKARIVSPNSNGIWEFVPAKQVFSNNTSKGFSFNMTAMPYQPYIKVESAFGRLYGNNYDDTRGLICGGDFSMPQINDQWKAYQIQNKNYQVMFNRQIESLDLQNKWAKRTDIAGAITGTIGGVAGGALSGSMMGGATGAVGGGLIGGVASIAGGAMDVYANRELRADQRDALMDQHNWQLDNIQALPYSVSKATNFNNEQPKVPYLEIYDCTDKEKTNFNNYLSLKSYNISRYGKFSDYVKPTGRTWLQGTFVRLNGISDDAHYLAAIADEVKQGFYIEKGEN